jgi:hypothetical protein
MDQTIGDLRERTARIESEITHAVDRLRSQESWTSHLSNSVGRLAARVETVERHRDTMSSAAETAREAMAWIKDREAAEKRKTEAKSEIRAARQDAIKLLTAAGGVVAMALYLVGLIDAEKFKLLASVTGLGK